MAPQVFHRQAEIMPGVKLSTVAQASYFSLLKAYIHFVCVTRGGQLLLRALCACTKNWPIAKLSARPLAVPPRTFYRHYTLHFCLVPSQSGSFSGNDFEPLGEQFPFSRFRLLKFTIKERFSECCIMRLPSELLEPMMKDFSREVLKWAVHGTQLGQCYAGNLLCGIFTNIV